MFQHLETLQSTSSSAIVLAKTLEDINRDLNVKLTELKQELHVQESQYEKLKHDFANRLVENDRLKQERDSLVGDKMVHQFFTDRYDYIVKQYLLPYAQEKCLQFDERTGETLDFVLIPLLQNAREAGILRDQVQTLQQELLVREKKIGVISDEQFAQDFRTLASHIKTLSRLLRPQEDVDVFESLGPCTLASGVASQHWSGRAGRKLFIEAWTWSNLLQRVFRSPFTIFGTESKTISNLWSSMFESQHCHGWPRPSFSCEIWRRTTTEQLVAVVDENIITHGKANGHYLYLEQCVVDARADTMRAIETKLALIAPTIGSSYVCQIVDKAFTLAMHMSLQRSRLQVTFPKIGDSFSNTEMKPLRIADEDPGNGIVVSIVNPGLTKWGNVHGRILDHRYNIVPALVQIQTLV
ncbi:hypothetical protein N0V83_010686 [Neocucurbitaria cava]|uniref:Uncharacterized protein n=1 Tax=Neocucurbitaria cava TaxID=798079 RepID=A0A9W8XXR1_9PLEO|nr:hypothetical protein N0V83_010686 [Neocucurbitaria cava]